MGLSSRLKAWIDDGNVIVKPNGRYATQCSQYTNSLTLKELVTYFIKEYVN
jgi:hypothetical protein